MQHGIVSKNEQATQELTKWREGEKLALELLQITGNLRFDKAVELVLFRHPIHGHSTTFLLKNHGFATRYGDKSISVKDCLDVAKAIATLDDLAPCKLDLGKLTTEWVQSANNHKNIVDFVHNKLNDFRGTKAKNGEPKDVVLYGFGRIGRIVARLLISDTGRGDQLRLRAIVLRPKMSNQLEEVIKRVSLLETDSVHGDFNGVIDISEDGSSICVNGNRIEIIFAKSPSDVDYTTYGINNALVIDNTGVWRDREALSQHLRPGIAQVLLTAPAKGDIENVVYGVNHEGLAIDEEKIYSAASCTTNAIAPVLQVVLDNLGIEKGHIETIHSYTNDQNLLDNFHKKPRRGRGAPVNMVLTTTGAASAVTKVNPAFKGKLTGNAIRVPTPNVSIAVLNLNLEKKTSVQEINQLLREAAYHGNLVEQIHFSDSTEYVSSNAIGMNTTSVVDAPSTIVSEDGKSATLYLWYDNEYGYSCQVVRLAKHIAKVRRFSYF